MPGACVAPACVPGAAVRHSLTQRLRWLPRRPLPRVSACACVCTVRGHGLVEAAGPERGRGCGGEREGGAVRGRVSDFRRVLCPCAPPGPCRSAGTCGQAAGRGHGCGGLC